MSGPSDDRLIRLRAYKETARDLATIVKTLKRGDSITATGSLSLARGKNPVMYVDRIEVME